MKPYKKSNTKYYGIWFVMTNYGIWFITTNYIGVFLAKSYSKY